MAISTISTIDKVIELSPAIATEEATATESICRIVIT
jgi:hypothetical protein